MEIQNNYSSDLNDVVKKKIRMQDGGGQNYIGAYTIFQLIKKIKCLANVQHIQLNLVFLLFALLKFKSF